MLIILTRFVTIQPFSHSMLVEVVNAVLEWPLFALCNGRDSYHYSHGGRRIMMDTYPASMSMAIEFAHPQAEEPASRPLMLALHVSCETSYKNASFIVLNTAKPHFDVTRTTIYLTRILCITRREKTR